MNEQRLVKITIAILSKNTEQVKKIAWQFLRSSSAKYEAELVNIAHSTQNEIIDVISRIKAKKLEQYNTNKQKEIIDNLLDKMISEYSYFAKQLVISNILAGKVSSLFGIKIKAEDLELKVLLNQMDNERIERFTNEMIARIKNGAMLAASSVNSLLQKAAIKSNMNTYDKTQKTPEDNDEKVKQEPLSVEFVGQALPDKKHYVKNREKELTKEQLDQIRNNPFVFVKEQAKKNVEFVKSLQMARNKEISEYNKQIRIQNASRTEKENNEKQTKQIKASEEILNEMISSLQKNGLYAFLDKGGKRWTLENYCAMTIRTTSSQTTNLGEVFSDEEHDLYYIVPHKGSCPICAKYEGKVYSRSGTNPNYPSLASVFGKIDPAGSNSLDNTYLTIHPNCRHKLVKYYEKKK